MSLPESVIYLLIGESCQGCSIRNPETPRRGLVMSSEGTDEVTGLDSCTQAGLSSKAAGPCAQDGAQW